MRYSSLQLLSKKLPLLTPQLELLIWARSGFSDRFLMVGIMKPIIHLYVKG